MNETLDAIAQRYACRAFRDEPVSAELLQQIAEAGLHAPSAFNRQPWRILTISDVGVIDTINDIGMETIRVEDPVGYERLQGRGGCMLYHAPAMMIVLGEKLDTPFDVAIDVGILVSHLALAATSLGVQSCICGFAMMAFEGETGAELKESLGFPDGFDFAASVLFGYEKGVAKTPHPIDRSKLISIG
jgi:nitroreductase